jgi:hypothetical protein
MRFFDRAAPARREMRPNLRVIIRVIVLVLLLAFLGACAKEWES